MPENILHLPEYHVLGTDVTEHDLHFQIETPVPVAFEVMRARMLYITKHKKKSPQTKESPFLGKATMTYSVGVPEPE